MSSISVIPANNGAGASSIHSITFTTATTLPIDGKIVVAYPSGFNISDVSIVSSSTMDGSFSFIKSGTTVTITRSGGTAQSGGETETIQLANVMNETHASSYTANIQTQDNAAIVLDAGLSNSFAIIPSNLDHFRVDGIGSSVIAGGTFTINIEALDFYENRVTSFANTVDLSDLTGSLSPRQTTSFTAGYWTGNLFSITKTIASNSITVFSVSQGRSGTSGYFRVDPAALSGFEFSSITSPQTAGSGFGIGITARDGFGNTKTDFISPVTLSEKTATLEVTSTGTGTTPAFIAGQWSGSVSITAADQDVQITATGSGRSGTSGYFNVNPGALDHFGIISVSDQSAGMPFLITVIALDGNENTATQFSGAGRRVNISHTGTGSITPAQSGNFINGIWTGTVSIAQTQTSDRISVDDGSGHSAVSNYFNVLSSPVDHFVLSSVGASQTAGNAFAVTINAVDAGGNTVTAFNGTSSVKDETGSIAPVQITFSGGSWSGTFGITKTASNDFLTVTGVGRTGTSNTFQVLPGSVASFDISPITSPKTSGAGFAATFTARDVYGNTVAGFGGTVTLDGGPVVVTPATSGAFAGGVRTETLNIARAQNDVQITIRDASAHIGTSNRFNVVPGALHHFAIGAIADQAAGMPFSVSVTAQDANNNTVSGFSGAGSTVAVSHAGAGPVSPAVSGNFTSGIWIGNVSIAQTQAGDQIVVTRSGGSQTGSSNTFAVTPSNVDHFVFTSISNLQTAGSGFGITIRAVDGSGNTVTSFAGSCSLIDETGTGTPSTIQFSAGQWIGNETITRSSTGNSLTVTGGGKSGTSNSFDIRPASAQSFEIGLIGSPKNAGVGFPITITAKDAYGNTASGFGGTVSISDAAGPVVPANSGAFANGVRNETVQITHSGQDVFLSVSDGSGHVGGSNFFNVLPGPVDHFEFMTVGSQVAKVPFTIIITAMDRFNSPATGFNGTVDMGDLSGTLAPIRSGTFISGHWSGGVTIDQASAVDRIRVSRTGGFESGTSNDFSVNAPPGVQAVSLTASVREVTAGQDQNWSLSMVVKNLASSAAQFDSLKVRFWLTGEQHDYRLILPNRFRHSGTAVLGGNKQDTLSIIVDKTGRSGGDVAIEATPYFTDGGTGLVVSDQGHSGIAVSDSARLRIDQIRLSQSEVTEDQSQDWTASVVITNTGGSEVVIDSSRARTFLTFSPPAAGWKYLKPQTLGGGTWRLAGGVQDSLTFLVEKTGSGVLGFCDINASVSGIEINTSRTLSTNTQNGGSARLKIESPADLRIVSMENLTVNRPYLDVNQSFVIRVSVENPGGDGLHNVQVLLESDGGSIFLDANSKNIETLAGGGRETMEFEIQASQMPNPAEAFTLRVSGYVDNTGDLTAEIEKTIGAVIQNPAELLVQSVTTSVPKLIGGQQDPWLVKVLVRNAGEAVLVLEAPQADDLGFWNEEIYQVDYSVRPPAGLKRGGLVLAGGSMDTLIYTVQTTGSLGGTVDVRASISGRGRNNPQNSLQTSEGSRTVSVQSNQAFRIISTQIEAVHMTGGYDGIVNTGQAFRIHVILENGIGQTVKNIKVQIGTDGDSEITDDAVALIATLRPTARRDTVTYRAVADTRENPAEIFSAKIIQALFENTEQAVPIGASLDSTAKVAIQSPARIVLQLTLDNPQVMVSTGQEFIVRAELQNRGSSELDGMAVVQLILPEGYSRAPASPSDTLNIGLKKSVEWTVRAPSEASAGDWISATLLSDRIPDDLNTGQPAAVDEPSSSIFIVTVASRLSVQLTIDSPEGAKDGILSTGQNFVLRAKVFRRYVRDVIAQIQLPSGYEIPDGAEKSVQDSLAIWQIRAPEAPAPQALIQVQVRGVDSLQQEIEVNGIAGSIEVSAVWRAELSLGLSITKPADVAENKTVSLGQEFEITARIQKTGEADTTGPARISLDPLTGGYTTSDPMTKSVRNGSAAWTIKAPMQQTAEAVSIKVKLTAAPLDENTGAEAMVIQPNDAVAVTMTGTWLAITPSVLPGWAAGTVTPGQDWVRLMNLVATNRGAEGSSSIRLESISFVVEDRFGGVIPPAGALAEIFAVDGRDSTRLFGRTSDLAENPFTLPFLNCVIPTEDSRSIAIFGRIADDPQTGFFEINIPSGEYINARDPNSHNSVSVMDATGEDWLQSGLRSDPKKIFEPGTETVLWNSPNPFSPSKGPTKIQYYLEKNTDVHFSLYTLVGGLVWTVSFDEPGPNTSQGMHTVLWDGRNGRTQQVMNGVYLLFMKTSDGKVVKTRIAVVK